MVIAAEQEGEPVQVLAQLADVVCGVTDELSQGGAEAPPIAGQPLAEELQQLGELGRVHGIEPDLGHAIHRLPGRGCAAQALYRWISRVVVRGTTPTTCPSTASRKLWSPAVTVTILPAWIRPTWIFWVATMMPPREDTRRCTITGPDGGAGLAEAFRAPRSRSRSPAGTGQGIV